MQDFRCYSVAAIIGLALSVTPSSAQTTAGDSGAASDIIVTARRVDERLQDVPISITVFSQNQISERNIITPADLATYTPSLSINGQFGPEKSTFIIRGFTQELGTAPSVGTYFADVVTPRVQSGTASGLPAGSFFDLQNVQVLKGPQGTLFGRNTTGGAVLLVPQKPTNNFEGYAEVSAGNYDMLRGQAVVNVPVTDTMRVRLGVDRNKRDGYLKNRGDGPDLNDVDYLALRFSVVADLTPDLENYFIGTYNRSDTNGTGSRIIGCDRSFLTPSADPSTIFQQTIAPLACAQLDRQTARGDKLTDLEEYNPNAAFKAETWQVINTTTFTASDTLTVKNIVSYSEYRERTTFNLFGDNFLSPLSPTLGPIPFLQLSQGPNGYTGAQSTFTEELQFQGQAFGERLKWQAGAYLEISNPLGFNTNEVQTSIRCTDRDNRQCSNIVEYGPLGAFFGSLGSAANETRFNNKGLYAQATYDLTEQLSLTGGLRYTIDKTRATARNVTIFFPAPNTPVTTCTDVIRFQGPGGTPLVVNDRWQCNAQFSNTSKRPTWLVGLDYKPVDDVLLYAKYARGYRQGGINTGSVGLESWGPEKVDTYEVGAKASWSGAVRGTFNISAFYNDFRDQQLQGNLVNKPGTPRTGGTAIINAGKSRIWGIEVDSSVTPFEGFRVDLGYTYLNTELLRIDLPVLPPESPFESIVPTAIVGDPLSYSPKNRLTLTGTYTLPIDESIGRISLGATYTYTSSQNGIARTASPFYRLPATNLLNLNAEWEDIAGSPISLAAFVTNVTNELYPVAAGGNWLFAGYQSVNVGAPRMFGGRIRYRFGN